MEDHQHHGSPMPPTNPQSHHYHHHHHHHIKKHRIPSGKDEAEEEELDPRIQVELERLNKASDEINKLELELDDARAGFRQVLSDSTQCLNGLAKKLGNCVDKARPYYDSRMKLKEAHVESQKAALRFERACSMHEAAKEMVQLAEEGYKRREEDLEPTWQEMLNHATMKVNEAEKERMESESNHQQTTISFKKREDDVQKLQKDLKRSITKSRPYFEMKAKFNQVMEEQKGIVSRLEESVAQAKALYSQALRNLEAISDDIHRTRLERRQNRELGERGAGVGAEAPSPPPSWDKGINIEGSASSCAFDSDGDDDTSQISHQGKADRGIVRHEAAHRNRSSVSEALAEAASLEPDPLNVVMFKTESPQSSSPLRNPANFHPPSVINPHPDRARSASYRAAVDSSQSQDGAKGDREISGVVGSEIEDREEFHDVTPTPESVDRLSLGISTAAIDSGSVQNDPHATTSPVSGPGSDLSMTQSSLSRAQEWVNRSPVPQQRRFVKSKSLINASMQSPLGLASASSPPELDIITSEEEDIPKPLSSSLTTAALRSMRAEQNPQPSSYMQRSLSSPREYRAESPSSHTLLRLHSAPVSTSSMSHQLKSSSLGSVGSVRSLGSTPPEDWSSPAASGTSPSLHRKFPKLQGLILKVDPSGGSSSGSSVGSIVKPVAPATSLASGHHHFGSAVSSHGQPQTLSAASLPRVIISTQHPTLGVFTEQVEQTPPKMSQQASGQAHVTPGAAPVTSTLSSTSPSPSPDTAQLSMSASPAPPPAHIKPLRHPTSLITQQLNKVMQAVAEASASSSPFKVSNYNSKTAPATLMGNAYRLPASTKPPHPQVSPMRNPPTPLSPTSSERGPAVTPGGRSDSLSTAGSSSIHSRSLHLKPPSDSSDTESIASTGPMLDDDQVELINMDFTEQSITNPEEADCDDDYDYPPIDPNLANSRGHWSRMSLPPRLNYLEGFLERARKFSGDQRTPEQEDAPRNDAAANQEGELPCTDVGNGDGLSKESQYVSSDESKVEGGPVLDAGQTGSEPDNVTISECDGDETHSNSVLHNEENSSDGICTKVEATIIISPDEGISVIEGVSDFTEQNDEESGELVTKEDHYL